MDKVASNRRPCDGISDERIMDGFSPSLMHQTSPLLMNRHRDSFLSSSSAAEEETEDSGGTLRMPAESNSITSLNQQLPSATTTPPVEDQKRFFVKTLVEYHGGDENAMEMKTLVYNNQQQESIDAKRIYEKNTCSSLNDLNNLPALRECDDEGHYHHHRPTAAESSFTIESEIASTSSSISAAENFADGYDGGANRQRGEHRVIDDYVYMDKVSCSSGSASHLSAPSHCKHALCRKCITRF